jgi:hypothetical protein
MSSVALWLDPLSDRLEADLLFDARNTPRSGERILEPYVHLRERLAGHGISVHTGDLLVRNQVPPADVNLYATMGLTTRYRALSKRADTVLSAFLVNECPIVEPRLFAELDAASDRFLRLYSFAPDAAMEPFLKRRLTFRPFRYPYPFAGVAEPAWSRPERSFLVVINGNKVPRLRDRELYTERVRAIEYFARFGEVDLYGVGWDGPPFRVGETRVPRTVRKLGYTAEKLWDRLRPDRDALLSAARSVYRGPVDAKSETLAGYRFSICFENMAMDGWVTEKIFDCLRAGTVPVYLGAPDIEHWVAPECFVDMRRFSDYAELREFLHQLSPAEIEDYRSAGREYFASERFRPFTKEAFADIFEQILREDAEVAL